MTEPGKNVSTATQRSPMERFLHGYFRRELDRAGADFSSEPLSYDGNSSYDHLCYGLVREGERLCRLRFGQAPSGCQLQRALAVAEFDRLREKRLKRRSAWQKTKDTVRHWFRRN